MSSDPKRLGFTACNLPPAKIPQPYTEAANAWSMCGWRNR